MSTSVEARQARPLNREALAHITDVPLVDFTPDGLLFDGDLSDEAIEAAWWFVTSKDDEDQAKREALYVRLGEAVTGTHAAGWQTDVLAEMLRYQLGLADPT